MSRFSDILQKIAKQDVFILNDFENIAIRSDYNGQQLYAKPQGLNEYKIKFAAHIVQEAFMEGKEITKEEYENY